ncbi:TIGR03943 family protein [Caloramator sp. ALD01]|uniref:TIGR03943 family putative permease subunit n=1 Tax=Caloramator sp. ALD01 TaxID=1031288 RepID=UPI000408425A|nr:TIGR03943 family protein [Caloramator sp. ALD01]
MRFENILWAGILFLLFLILSILNITGKIFYFLHPRLFIYSIFASVMLFILFLFEVYKLFKEKHHHYHKIRILPYFIFLIFIFVAGTYEFENASQNIAQNKEANFTFPIKTAGRVLGDGLTEVKNSNYLDVMDELHKNLDRYEGREIVIDGFVFKDKSFNENQFVVARMLITCCAADAQIIGLMVEGENNLKENEWVRVEGVIKKGVYNGEIIPVIKCKGVKLIEKPKEEYIYP